MDAAEQAGLGERVHAAALALESWTPDAPLISYSFSDTRPTTAAFTDGLSLSLPEPSGRVAWITR